MHKKQKLKLASSKKGTCYAAVQGASENTDYLRFRIKSQGVLLSLSLFLSLLLVHLSCCYYSSMSPRMAESSCVFNSVVYTGELVVPVWPSCLPMEQPAVSRTAELGLA